ncbi:hypothetical protein GGR21_000614 [Dysgonomonas hofstadii]|uniref:DUF3244 domain-containing protein n=1 Tax=Dysgonomonas hofstadii TaxID=637886 RepID=A0A840CFF2_9BACT|nr:DUF3244 domain-containing protein [Dysgonomonas hofstadii]MBB4034727.1 hypothetical protein [Dysgonomonas hofstadii]
MKQIILLASLIACIGLSANLKSLHIQETDTEKEIDLIGSLISPQTRMLIKPIILFQQMDCLRVNCSSSLGYISVLIYNNTGDLKYQKCINTSVESLLYISTLGLEAGNYTVKFVDSKDQSLIGNFIVQE